MSTVKDSRALAEFRTRGGFPGPMVVAAVREHLPPELFTELTGRQIGIVMAACNAAFHKGKKAAGAEMIDTDAVWIERLGRIIDLPIT
jgi:hypothetical protein